MLGRMLCRMGSPEELQAEACKQMDVDWCLFFFFLMISTGNQKKDKGSKAPMKGT